VLAQKANNELLNAKSLVFIYENGKHIPNERNSLCEIIRYESTRATDHTLKETHVYGVCLFEPVYVGCLVR